MKDASNAAFDNKDQIEYQYWRVGAGTIAGASKRNL